MDKSNFKAQLDSLREVAKNLGDPTIVALLDVVHERHERAGGVAAASAVGAAAKAPQTLTEVGDEMLRRLDKLGLPNETRTQIRQLLAAHRLATVACW